LSELTIALTPWTLARRDVEDRHADQATLAV
jgi:hypothetical protein